MLYKCFVFAGDPQILIFFKIIKHTQVEKSYLYRSFKRLDLTDNRSNKTVFFISFM